MLHAFLVAVVASAALPLGAAVGVWANPSRRAVAAMLAFASGALITAVAFELFEEAYAAGPWRAAIAFGGGAAVFIVADSWLERRSNSSARGGAVGLALLLGVTLDGVPENLAMGVALVEGSAVTLLVAVFASNLPEALVGARRMREAGYTPARVMALWSAVAVLLVLPVITGFGVLDGVSPTTLAWPLGFAAGAVLASLADTLMPEAYREGGPSVAYATALGFLLSFVVAGL